MHSRMSWAETSPSGPALERMRIRESDCEALESMPSTASWLSGTLRPMPIPTHAHELTEPVDLCTAEGRLNRAAVGWSRRPLHRCNLRGWGRTKRWEYWCFATPTHLVAITVSDLDYLGLTSVYFLEYGRRGIREAARTALRPLAAGVRLPRDLDAGEVGASGPVRVGMRREGDGTRVRFACDTPAGPLSGDLLAELPPGHETLGVVVPWSDRRFQYTSKHTARPARGTVRIGGDSFDFGGGWAVLDHGRGRWPYDTRWNWGAASGVTGGRTVGLQLGGTWTVGTGTTENALCVDGRLTRIGEELEWVRSDPAEPWSVCTPGTDRVDLVFTPFHVRRERIDAWLLGNETDQAFGHWSGTVRDQAGALITVEGLLGWVEQVHMRW
jgi:uncharacterized protein YaiE (UPF0345 family)